MVQKRRQPSQRRLPGRRWAWLGTFVLAALLLGVAALATPARAHAAQASSCQARIASQDLLPDHSNDTIHLDPDKENVPISITGT